VTGRVDDMLVIRGVNVYPSEVEQVLLADPAVAPQYLLVVDSRTARSRLVVVAETVRAAAGHGGAEDAAAGRGAAAARLATALRQRLGLSCEVLLVAPGDLPRTEAGKACRVVHWRDGDPPLPVLAGDTGPTGHDQDR
jgi:phenylacetate-CoA ligase